MNNFYQFRAEAGDEPAAAELMIFSTIGEWEDMGDVSARAFAKDLATLPNSVKRLDIHINSPGGSVFEAQGIYSRLADHRSTKHVYVDGLAASAASIIAMVGHKIYIRANANIMIHLPSGFAMGNSEDMRHMATALDSITESMINVYEKRTGQDRDAIRDFLAAETWFSPQEAVDNGFADEVRGVVKAAAVVGEKRAVFNGCEFDLSRFRNIPAFSATTNQPTKPMATKPKVTAAQGDGGATGDTDPSTPPTPPPPNEPAAPTAPPAHEPAAPPNAPAPPPPPNTAPAAAPAAAATDYERGVKEERARVSALQAMSRPATAAIIAAAIKDGKKPEDVFAACMEAMDKAQGRNARHADASVLNNIPPSDGAGDGEENEFGGRLKAAAAARRQSRSRNRRTTNTRS